MATEIVVASPLVEVVLEKVGSALLEESRLFFGAKNDLKKLQSTLLDISSMLAVAERSSEAEGDEQVRDWLKKLRSAAFDADDAVDEFQIEALRRKVPINFLRQVRGLFSPHNPIVFRCKMTYKIKCVRKRLDGILAEMSTYNFAKRSATVFLWSQLNLETSSRVIDSTVYGRDKDKENVIRRLVSTDNNKNISILPIVGLEGVGKTTLAQFVFKDMTIKRHFEICAWISAFNTDDERSTIRNILESITGDKFDLSNLKAMKQQIQEKLKNKKFLLILDGVWHGNEQEWTNIKFLLFTGGKYGSKILLTTRNFKIAEVMDTERPYILEVLSDVDCWKLGMAIISLRGKLPLYMHEIGNDILKIFSKCLGLPILVNALARLIGSTRGELEWLLRIRQEIEKFDIKNTISIVIWLIYKYLPSQLKQCFLYCSLFQKGSLIDKERLIKLWISEGLIPEDANAENICNENLNILLRMSLFEIGKTDYSGNTVSYRMLDLVHDVARFAAGDESCIVAAGSRIEKELGCRRYMSVEAHNVDKGSTIPEVDHKSAKLGRTFLTSRAYFGGIGGVRWGMMSTRLRVLDLSFTSIETLPTSLDILKHLRFLDLSWTEIRTIPASIISLQKLQTLYLINCYQLQQLPEGIVFLISLRHLDISGCYRLTRMPRGIGRLINLRTLPTFIVGKERGRTIMELEHLNQIRGKLQIDGLHCVKDVDEAVQAKLAEKTQLESLDLRWAWSASSSGDDTNKQENSFLTYIKKNSIAKIKGSIPAKEEDVLEKLQPPDNLKELRIIRYAGTSFPSWMTTTTGLPNLVTIVLFDIKRCESLRLGHLPSLRLLSLYCMPDLVEWSTEPISTGSGVELIYPRLERLLITNCPKLATLPEGLRGHTALRELQIKRCPLLTIQIQRKIGGRWRNTFEEDDFVARETESSSYRGEIEEELQEFVSDFVAQKKKSSSYRGEIEEELQEFVSDFVAQKKEKAAAIEER